MKRNIKRVPTRFLLMMNMKTGTTKGRRKEGSNLLLLRMSNIDLYGVIKSGSLTTKVYTQPHPESYEKHHTKHGGISPRQVSEDEMLLRWQVLQEGFQARDFQIVDRVGVEVVAEGVAYPPLP